MPTTNAFPHSHISHLHPSDMRDEQMLRSKLFEDSFDSAIVGKTANRHGRVVFVYDEDACIDSMLDQLEDAADGPGEVEWEDAAASITQGTSACSGSTTSR